MTTEQKIIKNKVGVMEPARTFGNAVRVCRVTGPQLFRLSNEVFDTEMRPAQNRPILDLAVPRIARAQNGCEKGHFGDIASDCRHV
jgi:hypothetical protein